MSYWKNDSATREFIEAHKDALAEPKTMPDKLLGEAVKHCKTTDNPYSYELMRRIRRAR